MAIFLTRKSDKRVFPVGGKVARDSGSPSYVGKIKVEPKKESYPNLRQMTSMVVWGTKDEDVGATVKYKGKLYTIKNVSKKKTIDIDTYRVIITLKPKLYVGAIVDTNQSYYTKTFSSRSLAEKHNTKSVAKVAEMI